MLEHTLHSMKKKDMHACLLETRTFLTVKTEYGKKITHE
jgi:hypothetical protein